MSVHWRNFVLDTVRDIEFNIGRLPVPKPFQVLNSLEFLPTRPQLYEARGKLQIQILCGADDNLRQRMNTAR